MLKSERQWKTAIFLCVTAFVIATILSMTIAAKRVTQVVDADYYQHGMDYRSTRPTGWTMNAAVQRDALEVSVRDGKGSPVSGGHLEYRTEQGDSPIAHPLILKEASAGIYRAACSASGDLRGTLRFSKGEAVLSSKMVLLH